MPGVVTLMGAEQLATPDNASEHVNVIATGVVVLMPLAFGAGEMLYEIVGGVLSMLRTMLAAAAFPAASVAVPETV